MDTRSRVHRANRHLVPRDTRQSQTPRSQFRALAYQTSPRRHLRRFLLRFHGDANRIDNEREPSEQPRQRPSSECTEPQWRTQAEPNCPRRVSEENRSAFCRHLVESRRQDNTLPDQTETREATRCNPSKRCDRTARAPAHGTGRRAAGSGDWQEAARTAQAEQLEHPPPAARTESKLTHLHSPPDHHE
jgi:hypothetical protein